MLQYEAFIAIHEILKYYKTLSSAAACRLSERCTITTTAAASAAVQINHQHC
jgi:hypothetical protein